MRQANRRKGKLVMLLCMALSPFTPAAIVQAEPGQTQGEIYVTGNLLQSACQLAMESAYQTVTLGDIGSARLRNPGERGPAIEIAIMLRDCVSSDSDLRDSRGNRLWSRDQPAISVQFYGVKDALNPELFSLQGVKGVGLRLLDGDRQPLSAQALWTSRSLLPGDNRLIWHIAAERTLGVLQPGSYYAVLHLGVSYD